MPTNQQKVMGDEPNNGVSSLGKYLEERPLCRIPSPKVTEVRDVLAILDVIKGGLVSVRGGHFADQAFIILNTDIDTDLLFRIVRPCVQCRLITPVGVSLFLKRFFYEKTHTRKVRVTQKNFSKHGGIGVEVGDIITINSENGNYLPGRHVLNMTMESAQSAIYLAISYLEVFLDAFDIASYPATHIWEGFKKMSSWPTESFVKYAKYITAYPIARYLKQSDVPPKPDGLVSWSVFGGPFYRIIHSRMVSTNDKSSRFFFGLLQGVKRGANIVGKAFLQQAYEKHMSTLTTPTASIDEGFLMGNFYKLSSKLFSRISLSQVQILKITEPSKSAVLTATRMEGGQETEVREALGIPSINDFDYDTARVGWIGQDILSGEELKEEDLRESLNGISEYYQSFLNTHSFFDSLYSMVETKDGIKEFRGHEVTGWEKRKLIHRVAKWKEPLSCRIVALSEPLKVRTISAGDSIPYYLGKPFQKSVWSYLRSFPQFIVIGEPLTSAHLSSMMDRESELSRMLKRMNDDCFLSKKMCRPYRLPPSEFFNSGDYSAATDNLKIEYTLATFDVVADQMRSFASRSYNHNDYDLVDDYLKVMRKLLEPHFLWYNDKDEIYSKYAKEKGIPYKLMYIDQKTFCVVDQKNGQLMGSPISFPFLCAINFICYWHSLNKYCNFLIPFRLLPVLINGDDILFRTNPHHFTIWKSTITEVGFTLSLGKNYTHKELLTINSELFRHVPGPQGWDEFIKLDYLNVGLLIAQSKGRLADPRRRLSLRELYIYSVGGSLDKLRSHNRFLHYNKLVISEMTDRGKYNLFMPVMYGGLGFPIYEEIKSYLYFTKFQRRFATFLLSKMEEVLRRGEYKSKYFCALIVDTTPIRSLIRRRGMLQLKLGSSCPSPGWSVFDIPSPDTMNPMSAEQLLESTPDPEYRLPSRSLLREFSRIQFALKNGEMKEHLFSHCLSNEEIFAPAFTHIHKRNLLEEEGEPLTLS